MTYPKTLAALREQEDRSWAVADALVEEIRSHEGGRVLNGEYDRCAEWLAEQGYDVTPRYLMQMRQTAEKFVLSERTKWPTIPFRLFMTAAQSANWTPDLMDEAEREGWTLRQFSEKLTGKRWADTDIEAAKRVLRDPEKLAEVSEELESEEAARAAAELNRRAWQAPSAEPYPPVKPWANPLTEDERSRREESSVTERDLAEAAAANPLGGESLGAPIGIMGDLAAINAALGRIEAAAANPRIDWSAMRESVTDSLTQKQERMENIKLLINTATPAFTDRDYDSLLQEEK